MDRVANHRTVTSVTLACTTGTATPRRTSGSCRQLRACSSRSSKGAGPATWSACGRGALRTSCGTCAGSLSLLLLRPRSDRVDGLVVLPHLRRHLLPEGLDGTPEQHLALARVLRDPLAEEVHGELILPGIGELAREPRERLPHPLFDNRYEADAFAALDSTVRRRLGRRRDLPLLV